MYKDKLFKQTEVWPWGPSLAISFIGHLEKTFIMDFVHAPSFYNGYIDDICAILAESENIQQFVSFINVLHAN